MTFGQLDICFHRKGEYTQFIQNLQEKFPNLDIFTEENEAGYHVEIPITAEIIFYLDSIKERASRYATVLENINGTYLN